MKIEKINDNQIRCTLTPADLADRQLKLSELVCGTEKAKSLLHDMINQAASEFGFEVEDMPLMIEAVPASSDSIVLIITKVDDPEELDAKFSKFGTAANSSIAKKQAVLDKLEGAEEFLDLLGKIRKAVSQPSEAVEKEAKQETPSRVRLFSFATLDSVIHACHLLENMYQGANTLYKDAENDYYILAMMQSDHSTGDFNKICNMLSEYGSAEKTTGATCAYLEEHCEVLVSESAVQQLGKL